MRVVVVGCGPAGLAAAHAAVGLGANVEVVAPKVKTPQEGPLLVQRPIPGINTDHPDGTIHQRVVGGSILDYRYKLYGDINIGINGDILAPQYHAWDHRATYDRLWKMHKNLIRDATLTRLGLFHMQYDKSIDLVVSTANAMRLCFVPYQHQFRSAQVAVTPKAIYPGQPDDTIIFNAREGEPWVRSSRIFGVEVTEWLLDEHPEDARIISKPISSNCNCYPKLLRTGRFGAWRNETWVDTAYWDVYNMISSMTRSRELEEIQ